MNNQGTLYWITGLSGAGKTTIGNRLYYEIKKKRDNVVLLDGDILKTIVGDTLGYTESDRRKRAIKYAQLCKMLTNQGITVICCTIAMFDEVREWNRRNNKGYVEIYLEVSMDVLLKRDQKGMYSKQKEGELNHLAGIDVNVEFPKSPDIVIQNDGRFTVKECVEQILNHTVSFSSDYDRDSDYWNQYYEGGNAADDPSLFAGFALTQMECGKNLLELGCGNGRDSLFFFKNGLNVIGIDASVSIICELQKKYHDIDICFVCDDFVCSPTIFVGQYDYVYSRFSLHAINEQQEEEVIENVYNGLKQYGKFFIEVRSVHDEIYGLGRQVGKNSYIYQGHFRRFVEMKELIDKLKQYHFTVTYAKEQIDFAPYGDSNPPIIRIIAEKRT